MLIKICGITRAEDAAAAVEAGASALGFVFWEQSPRFVEPAVAAGIAARLPGGVLPVGVFVDAPIETVARIAGEVGLGAVQLHGSETAEQARTLAWPVYRSATLDDAADLRETWPPETVLLLDAHDPVWRGGTGRTVDWRRAARLAVGGRVVLAGGLTPDNVAEAIGVVRPWGVDVSSGVEEAPGRKSADKVARFVGNARRAFEEAVSA